MRMFRWLKSRISHKLEHLRWSNVKQLFRENGLALVVIIVGWEIIEDVLFPVIFALLGQYVHPVFFAGIPAAWLLCLHWLMVPILWGAWVRLKQRELETYETLPVRVKCDHDHESG